MFHAECKEDTAFKEWLEDKGIKMKQDYNVLISMISITFYSSCKFIIILSETIYCIYMTVGSLRLHDTSGNLCNVIQELKS